MLSSRLMKGVFQRGTAGGVERGVERGVLPGEVNRLMLVGEMTSDMAPLTGLMLEYVNSCCRREKSEMFRYNYCTVYIMKVNQRDYGRMKEICIPGLVGGQRWLGEGG